MASVSTVGLVAVSPVVHSVGKGMPIIEGSLYPFFPNDLFSSLVAIHVSLQQWSSQSFSDVRITLLI
jgi:hypothetical protein